MSIRQPPFGRHPGERPRLNDADVRDIVAFLNALSDGYHADETPASQKVCHWNFTLRAKNLGH